MIYGGPFVAGGGLSLCNRRAGGPLVVQQDGRSDLFVRGALLLRDTGFKSRSEQKFCDFTAGTYQLPSSMLDKNC